MRKSFCPKITNAEGDVIETSIVDKFLRRTKRIGIEIELSGNYPWVYMEKVNGKKVSGAFYSNMNKFTAFLLTKELKFSDRREVFKKIREML